MPHAILANLTDDERAAYLNTLTAVAYEPGDILFEEGNPVAVTVEIAIEIYDGLFLSRALDDETDMPLFNLDAQTVEERKKK